MTECEHREELAGIHDSLILLTTCIAVTATLLRVIHGSVVQWTSARFLRSRARALRQRLSVLQPRIIVRYPLVVSKVF